jgi:disulfide bond formation protein DsbB
VSRPRSIALISIALGLVALGIALGSEHFLGLIPCALCYLERWPYRIAVAVGVLALVLPKHLARLACWLLVLVFLAGAAAAFVHVGVEQHWWVSPMPECTAPNLSGLSPAERFARMPLRPAKACEDPDYLIPAIPISMTQGNLIYALASAALVAMLLLRAPARSRRFR